MHANDTADAAAELPIRSSTARTLAELVLERLTVRRYCYLQPVDDEPRYTICHLTWSTNPPPV